MLAGSGDSTLIDVDFTMGSFPPGVARTGKTTVVVGTSTVVVAWHGGVESALVDVHVTGGSFPSSNARTRNFVVAGAGVGASTVAMAGCSGAIVDIVEAVCAVITRST